MAYYMFPEWSNVKHAFGKKKTTLSLPGNVDYVAPHL